MLFILQDDSSNIEMIIALASVENPHSIIYDVFFESLIESLDRKVN